jgi:hypothetical protein
MTRECPTICDTDCEELCHEAHLARSRRDHDPRSCPAVLERNHSDLMSLLWLTIAIDVMVTAILIVLGFTWMPRLLVVAVGISAVSVVIAFRLGFLLRSVEKRLHEEA